MKTFGFGTINWTGFKSVLLHTFWAFVVAVLLALADTLSHRNWGSLQPYAIPLFTFVIAFIKKTAETYSVTPIDATVKVSDKTGSVTADESSTKK